MNAMQKNQAMVSRSDDRPNDSLAVSRMFNPATPVKRYSPIAKLKDLSGDGKVTQKDVLIGRGVIDAPTKRFCGGTSKPYKRKK